MSELLKLYPCFDSRRMPINLTKKIQQPTRINYSQLKLPNISKQLDRPPIQNSMDSRLNFDQLDQSKNLESYLSARPKVQLFKMTRITRKMHSKKLSSLLAEIDDLQVQQNSVGYMRVQKNRNKNMIMPSIKIQNQSRLQNAQEF